MSNKRDNISISVIRRLPRYYRFLGDLIKNGVSRISSRELSQRMGLTASQIRQDLNCFGGFGQQGYGYIVEQLYEEVGRILGVDNARSAILIGAGNLGRAIANHMQFEARGFELIGIFDRREELTGQQINGITIRNSNTLGQFCEEHNPVVAFLCIPREATMETAQQLIDYGVKGFWNFSHYDLSVQFPEVVVENVHLGDSLLTLSYRISEVEDQKDSAAKKL